MKNTNTTPIPIAANTTSAPSTTIYDFALYSRLYLHQYYYSLERQEYAFTVKLFSLDDSDNIYICYLAVPDKDYLSLYPSDAFKNIVTYYSFNIKAFKTNFTLTTEEAFYTNLNTILHFYGLDKNL